MRRRSRRDDRAGHDGWSNAVEAGGIGVEAPTAVDDARSTFPARCPIPGADVKLLALHVEQTAPAALSLPGRA